MRRVFVLLICMILCINMNSYALYDRTYDLRNLPDDLDAIYPYRETNSQVRYAPWLINYTVQTDHNAKRNMPGGENMQVCMSIGMSQVTNKYMVLGFDDSSVSYSNDGGENWYKGTVDGGATWGAHSVIFHPSEDKTVYFISGCTHEAPYQYDVALGSSNKCGIFKSVDGGKNFRQVLSVFCWPGYESNRLLAFDGEENIYAMTNNDIMFSEDGESWESIYHTENTPSGLYDFAVSEDGQRLMCATSNGFFVSFDRGKTWKNKGANYGKTNTIVHGFVVDPRNEKHWVATFTNKEYQGLYETFDNGNSWQSVTSSVKRGYKVYYGPVKENGIPTLYVMQHKNQQLIYSEDDGKTWKTPILEEGHINRVHDMNTQLFGFTISNLDPNFCVYPYYGPYISRDGGKTFKWSAAGECGLMVYTSKFDSKGNGYFGCADIKIMRTNEPITRENDMPSGEYLFNTNSNYMRSIAIDPFNENHVMFSDMREYAGYNYIYESYDRGDTYVDIIDKVKRGTIVAFHNEDPDVIYGSHYTSRDGGKTYEPNEVVISVVSPVDNDYVYGVDEKYLYMSKDRGITWEKVYEHNLTYVNLGEDEFNADGVFLMAARKRFVGHFVNGEMDVLSDNIKIHKGFVCDKIAQNPLDENHILLTCLAEYEERVQYSIDYGLGLLESFDGGKTWHCLPGLPGIGKVYGIDFQKSTGYAYVGGYFGLYVYDYTKHLDYIEKNPGYLDKHSVTFYK